MPPRGAFTLLELVVVMALLTAVAIGVGWGLRGDFGDVRLEAASEVVRSYFQSSRAAAIRFRRPVRLLLREEPAAPARHRRQWAAVVQAEADPRRWVALDDGVVLPAPIICIPPGDPADSPWEGLMQLAFPRTAAVLPGRGGHWRFLTIEANGGIRSPGVLVLVAEAGEPGAKFTAANHRASRQLQMGISRFGGIMVFDSKEAHP